MAEEPGMDPPISEQQQQQPLHENKRTDIVLPTGPPLSHGDGNVAGLGASKFVVILGGGFGGLSVATALQKHMRSSGVLANYGFVLVERNYEHKIPVASNFAFADRAEPEQIIRFYKHASLKHVTRLQEEIIRIDTVQKQVICRTTIIDYEILVCSVGVQIDWGVVDRLQQAAFNLWSLQDVMQLRSAIQFIDKGTILLTSHGEPSPIIYEYAFLIRFILDKRSKTSQGMHNFNADIRVVVAVPDKHVYPMPGQHAVSEAMKDRQIDFLPSHTLFFVDPRRKSVIFDNGVDMTYDILVTLPPTKAAQCLIDSKMVDDSGFVPTNFQTLKTKWNGVYCIGDCASFVHSHPESRNFRFPKLGTLATRQAEVVADDIARMLENKGSLSKWDASKGVAMDEPVTAIMEVGFHRAIKTTLDLFQSDRAARVAVSDPSKDHLKEVATWWTNLSNKWYEPEPDPNANQMEDDEVHPALPAENAIQLPPPSE